MFPSKRTPDIYPNTIKILPDIWVLEHKYNAKINTTIKNKTKTKLKKDVITDFAH
jgi:hypothetical protein